MTDSDVTTAPMSNDQTETEDLTANRAWVRPLLATLGLVGVFLGFLSWAVSSPHVSTPDEDYHLGSIWCPRPIEGSGCSYSTVEGSIATIEVPESINQGKCQAFMPEQDASCTLNYPDDVRGETTRFDDGGYPTGYYQFQHLFVGKKVFESVVWMRIVNSMLALGGVALTAALAAPSTRREILVATVVAWVPMGVYYLASVNPSSWAISGIFLFTVATFCAAQSGDWRRWALLGIAGVGVGLAVTSRVDSSFYVFVSSVALWMLIPIGKRRAPELAFTVAASIVGFAVFLSTTEPASMTSPSDWPTVTNMSIPQLFVANLLSMPEYFANMWGLNYGPGWLDTPLLGWSTLTMLFLAGGLFLVAAKDLKARSVLASIVLIGGLLGIPVVTMTMRHVWPASLYQPRYTLPLLAVLLFVWLWRADGRDYLGGARVWCVVVVASVANFFALRQVILRYAVGIDDRPLNGLLRFHGVKWWPWAVPPEVVLWGGSAALAAGLVALFLSIPRDRDPGHAKWQVAASDQFNRPLGRLEAR